jgi:hypothetical protein
MRRSTELGPGASATLALYQPALQMSGDGLAVMVDGREYDVHMPVAAQHASYGAASNLKTVVLTTRALFSDVETALVPASASGHGTGRRRSGRPDFLIAQSDRDTADWSRSWLGYSRYDCIILHRKDAERMPAAALSALWRHVECGGMVCFLEGTDIPAPWAEREVSRLSDLRAYAVGFGLAAVLASPTLSQASGDAVDFIKNNANLGKNPWTHSRDWRSLHKAFDMEDKFTVPVGGMFLLILVFGLTIGPANLFVLAKLNRRIWMVWTVPAASLATCGLIFLYSVFAEGFAATGRTRALTLLDEANQRAMTLGHAVFYSPLTPSGGLRYGVDTEVTSMNDDPRFAHHGMQAGGPKTIDWTVDQHLKEGWIAARVPACFMIRANQLRRERLELEREEGGGISVVNGLGADIKRLVVADRKGRLYTAGHIAAGAKASLRLAAGAKASLRPGGTVKLSSHTAANTFRNLYIRDRWYQAYADAEGRLDEYLTPGAYAAVMDAATAKDPFLERGLGKATFDAEESIVFGLSPDMP